MEMHEERSNRVKSFLIGKTLGPVSLDLKITNLCNLNCLCCPFNATGRDLTGEISKDRLLSLVDEASDLGVKEIMLTGGGEAFVRGDLILELMNKIKKRGIIGTLITNGTLIPKDDVKKIVSMEWDKIMFSLDSPDKKVHDYLRQKEGTFKKVIETLKYFQNTKSELNKELPRICLHPILTNLNYDQIDGFIHLCKDYGIDEICLQRLVIWKEEMKKFELNQQQSKEFQSMLPDYIKLFDKLEIYTNLNNFLHDTAKQSETRDQYVKSENRIKDIPKDRCFLPVTDIGICPNGDIGLCKRSDFAFFNIKKGSLKEIWYSKQLEDFRKKITKGEKPDFCSICSSGDLDINRFIEKDVRIFL